MKYEGYSSNLSRYPHVFHKITTVAVGWLKPWMLPEILSVSVPDELIARNAQFGTSRAFIEKFNAEHGHVSQIKIDELRSKNGDAEAVMVE